MLSTRVLFACVLLATVAARPTAKPAVSKPVTTITDEDIDNGEGGWFSLPMFGNLFAPLWRHFPKYADFGPKYADFGPKITKDKEKFQVAVEVKDYKKSDLEVKVKGNSIYIKGSHERKQDVHDIFSNQFSYSYTLPSHASGSDVTADLFNNGYLIVTAPRKRTEYRPWEIDREVPIIETGVPYLNESSPSQIRPTPSFWWTSSDEWW